MRAISKQDFDARGVFRNPAVMKMFTEKRWFEHAALLGCIMFDTDCEWAWVVLANDGDRYRGIDMGTSILTEQIALDQLERAFREHEHETVIEQGPPASPEFMASILEEAQGVPREVTLEVFRTGKIPGSDRGKA